MNRALLKSAIAIAVVSACPFAICAEATLTNTEATAASGDKMRDARAVAEIGLHASDGKIVVESRTLGPAYIEAGGGEAVVTGPLFTLAIDSDNDPATGKSPPFVHDIKGVEWQVKVEVCGYETSQAQPTAQHCVHGAWGQNLAGATARVTLRDLADPGSGEEIVETVTVPAPGRAVHFEIPYERIDAKPGDSLRVHAIGSRANGVLGAITPATELTLK